MNRNLTIPEAMIFDMDGTLFKTETLIIPAYHRTFDQLRAEGLFHGETPPVERLLSGLGKLLIHIWQQVMPDASDHVIRRADELLLEYQLTGLQEGVGELYPDVKQTLHTLKQRGVRLFVASNGLEDYVKGVARATGIDVYFEALYSAGEFQTPSKVNLVQLLLERYSIDQAWMIGDRFSDVEAGKENGLFVVGCNYARFGDATEIANADVQIDQFAQLLSLSK